MIDGEKFQPKGPDMGQTQEALDERAVVSLPDGREVIFIKNGKNGVKPSTSPIGAPVGSVEWRNAYREARKTLYGTK